MGADTGADLVVIPVDLEGVLTIDDIARRLHDAYRRLPASRAGRVVRRLLDGLRTLGFSAGVAGMQFTPRRPSEATPVLEQLLDLPYTAAGKAAVRVLVVLDEFQAVGQVANADAILRSRIQHRGPRPADRARGRTPPEGRVPG